MESIIRIIIEIFDLRTLLQENLSWFKTTRVMLTMLRYPGCDPDMQIGESGKCENSRLHNMRVHENLVRFLHL